MSLALLEIQNPWWTQPDWFAQDLHLSGLKKKPTYYDRPEAAALAKSAPGIHIIRGPRQVGKTTLLKNIAHIWLSENDHQPKNLLFLSCESIADYRELESLLMPWLDQHRGVGGILLDEISFTQEWPRAILSMANKGLLVDKSVWITGSNARDLKESGERLPGRRNSGRDISVFPFGFKELRQMPFFLKLDDVELTNLYLKIGGFPHAVSDYAEFGFVRDETYLTYRNWIIGDASRYGLSGEILSHLLYRVLETVSSRITWTKLIETTSVKSHETAQEYLTHIEDSFLAHIFACYDPEKHLGNLSKARKLYFVDPLIYGLAFAWRTGAANPFRWFESELEEPAFRGKIFESVVASRMKRQHERVYFWYSAKTQQEVDIVLDRGQNFELFDVKLSQPSHVPKVLGQSQKIILPEDFAAL